MKDYRILTYGRLSQEFAEYANSFAQLKCVAFSSKEEVIKHLPEFNAVAGFNFLKGLNLTHIEWLHCFVAGVDSYLALGNLPTTVRISRTSGHMGRKIGEYCLAYILNDLKKIPSVAQLQKKVHWEQQLLPNLYQKKVVIFGTGSIGASIAHMLAPLAKQVVGVNQSGRLAPHFHKVIALSQFQRFEHSDCDIVINALPLTPETTYFFSEEIFQKFRNALFINIGRGKSVDVPDLLKAIHAEHIAHAVLDVFEEEPLPANSPLWLNPHITITPHHSGVTDWEDVKESFQRVYESLRHEKPSPLWVNRQRGY